MKPPHDPSPRRFVVVGNPENRRVRYYQEALARLRLPAAAVLSYEDLFAGRRALEEELLPSTVLRIESPGENWSVEKALLAAGAEEAAAEGSPFLPPEDVEKLEFDRGLILHPRQWFLGFRAWLRRWGEAIDAAPGVRVLNHPADIEVMFDKRLCHRALRSAGIPVPERLGEPRSYDELLALMEESGHDRVFVKLAHGSSASGVVALRRLGPHRQAVTTAELVRERGRVRLYNSLKIRRYTAPRDIANVIDALGREGVHVERWLPKARLDGQAFDLRVMVIGGRARHLVVRQSHHPMTNLHLGNRRGDREAFLARLGDAAWAELRRTCERAMEAFPSSWYAGVDVALEPGYRKHAVLEINAFGDLLPGVQSHGADTYTAELAAFVAAPDVP